MLVSVVIPNYNYERYVGAAIESALSLDWPAAEIIVVDDGSTDGSRAVIDRYRKRVQVIHKANGGQGERQQTQQCQGSGRKKFGKSHGCDDLEGKKRMWRIKDGAVL